MGECKIEGPVRGNVQMVMQHAQTTNAPWSEGRGPVSDTDCLPSPICAPRHGLPVNWQRSNERQRQIEGEREGERESATS